MKDLRYIFMTIFKVEWQYIMRMICLIVENIKNKYVIPKFGLNWENMCFILLK